MFQKPISALENEPRMEADELKGYFDSSPNELKDSLNGIIDDLKCAGAAKDIGFATSVNVQADTVQDAIENVHAQLKNISLGAVPDGSISQKKLSDDVVSKFSDIQTQFSGVDSKINTTAAAAAAADSTNKLELQNAINNVNSSLLNRINANSSSISAINTALSAKSECYIGTFSGNKQPSQFISLGFTPKAVLLTSERGHMEDDGMSYGGLALTGAPCFNSNAVVSILEITEGGFTVYYNTSAYVYANDSYMKRYYIAIK